MGKRKIGEIYNKPIVEGDKNLVTNNEIHKSELSGGSGGGSGESAASDIYIEYYGEGAVNQLASMGLPINPILMMFIPAGAVSFVKVGHEIMPFHSWSVEEMQTLNIRAFAIIYGTRIYMDGNGIENDITFTPEFLDSSMDGFYSMISQHKITREEFYSLN